MQLCYKIIKLIFFILMYHCTKQIFSDNKGAKFFLQGYVVYCHKYHKKKINFFVLPVRNHLTQKFKLLANKLTMYTTLFNNSPPVRLPLAHEVHFVHKFEHGILQNLNSPYYQKV